MSPEAPRDASLSYDQGVTAQFTNTAGRLQPMADLVGGVITDIRAGDLEAVEALDLHAQATLILADLFSTIHDECVPSYEMEMA